MMTRKDDEESESKVPCGTTMFEGASESCSTHLVPKFPT